jgi:hypothetical protein
MADRGHRRSELVRTLAGIGVALLIVVTALIATVEQRPDVEWSTVAPVFHPYEERSLRILAFAEEMLKIRSQSNPVWGRFSPFSSLQVMFSFHCYPYI